MVEDADDDDVDESGEEPQEEGVPARGGQHGVDHKDGVEGHGHRVHRGQHAHVGIERAEGVQQGQQEQPDQHRDQPVVLEEDVPEED